MHSAPSVTYPVGRSHFQGWLIGLTGVIGMLTDLLWLHQVDLIGWRQGLFATVLIFSFVVAFHAWHRSPQGVLKWDGQSWHWISGEVTYCGVVAAHLDFQKFVLLSLHMETGKRLWLWPERQADVTCWNALRRSIFSRSSATQIQDENSDAQHSPVNA